MNNTERLILDIGALKAENDKLRAEVEKLLRESKEDFAKAEEQLATLGLESSELLQALRSMLESYGASIGEVAGVKTPLSPLAIKAVKMFFVDAKRCNEVYHKYAERIGGKRSGA